MNVAVLIVAAGRGSRAADAANPAAAPKQYATLGGRSVLAHSIATFAAHSQIARILVAIHPDDAALYCASLGGQASAKLLPPVFGGATRQESVRLGLAGLEAATPDVVLIHDAARPFVSADTIDRVLGAIGTRGGKIAGAIAALPLSDTLKRAAVGDMIAGTVERTGLWRAQTPQGFVFKSILSAHNSARAAGRDDFTDDAAIAEWAGLDVALVAGAERNSKLTTVEDLAMAEQMIMSPPGEAEREVRTGSGFDVHRFADGDGVWLCGIKIPHSHRLDGHSDADVALHALTDALLGAICDGDIGQHFPPSDAKWKGAASHIFLRHASRLVAERGGRITHVDITILAEAPKIQPHRQVLRQSVADILGLDIGRVSVKATTTEGLGFTGRREGIAAMASATITVPAT